jgi:hypothetical protein
MTFPIAPTLILATALSLVGAAGNAMAQTPCSNDCGVVQTVKFVEQKARAAVSEWSRAVLSAA